MDPAQSPLDHAEIFGRLVQRKLTLTEFACEVVLATNHSSEYCSKLQKHLDAQACVRRIAAPPQNETDHTLSVRVFKCLRIWNMAFQIQEDSHKAHTGKKSRSTMRIEAEKFAAESFDITTLETRKLNFLCLIGSCGLLPMPLEEFNELYKKVPDGHEQGAVIRTRIQKYIKGSHLPFLSWEKAEKRGFSDLDDGECGMYMSVEMS
jgi:hypothetical protein